MRPFSLAVLALSIIGPAVSHPCSSVVGRVAESVSWFTDYGEPVPERFLAYDENADTIYKTLKRKLEFSKLIEIIDKLDRVRKELDGDTHLTFFAPNNEAIEKHHVYRWYNDKEKKKMMEEALEYSMIRGERDIRRLSENSTLATELRADDGSFDDAHRRVKVQHTGGTPGGTITLNNYARVVEADIRCKNGVIHAISAPLFMPPDIMDIIYMLPTELSISSTALLKTNLQNEYEFNSNYNKDKRRRDHRNDRYGCGSPATTIFVPSNQAWELLPEDLRLFLFSPAGERTLRKLMAWHTLPDTVVFTEWVREVKGGRHVDDRDLGFEWDRHFRSLLTNQKMPVHVKKTKRSGSDGYMITLQAHGLLTMLMDNPAQNGAFHVVPQVLSPRNVEGVNEAQNERDWMEWREWLIDWSHDHENDSD